MSRLFPLASPLLLATLLAGVAGAACRASDAAGGARHYESTLLTSTRVEYDGGIEVSADGTRIERVAPGAYLRVYDRQLLRTRRLQVTAGPGGEPEYLFTVGYRSRPRAEALDFLAWKLPEIVATTGLGGSARVRRLFEEGGVRAVLRAVEDLESSRAQRLYLEELLGLATLEPADAVAVARVAGESIASSSALGDTLERLAAELPGGAEVTAELARAAGEIASSSERSAALVAIARVRGLDGGVAFAEAAEGIASSSQKATAVERLAALAGADETVVEALRRPARSIDSSSEKRRALEALVGAADEGAGVYAGLVEDGAGIASSSEKAAFLTSALGARKRLAATDARALLRAAGTIDSSSERQRVLLGLIAHPGLPDESWSELFASAARIPSSSLKADVLVDASRRCPADPATQRAYLEAAASIESSSEAGRALLALVESGRASRATLEATIEVARREIASSSERERVIERAMELLR